MLKDAQKILKEIFGYSEFRNLQKPIIERMLKRQDVLAIMPTGSGKSLCYQIPALLFPGLTVVVSPLISLMKDQTEQLRATGIAAAYLNSSLTQDDYFSVIQGLQNKQFKLIYFAPETLSKPSILNLLKKLPVDCLAIDEAHCISEWGHDFRPEYRQLIQVRQAFPRAVCIALTATATVRVREDIIKSLEFKQQAEFISSFNRENLNLQVTAKEIPFQQTLDFIEPFKGQSGIIYCFSRSTVETVCQKLVARGFTAVAYHAGLLDRERHIHQEKFIQDEVQIMVATIAFGMGINKPDIRFVVHYDLPKNIESYYQQIGRAGRDGLNASCLLLYGPADIQKIIYIMREKSPPERKIARLHLNQLLGFIETDECRRVPLLNYFGETYTNIPCQMCDNCLEEQQAKKDYTIAAQKFLSCILRTNQLYGSSHIIDILRGSENKKVLSANHHKLSTYGIGQDLTKKQWQILSRQLLIKDYVQQDLQYGSLKITDKAVGVLKGNKQFWTILEKKEIQTKQAENLPQDMESDLLSRLKSKRKQLADQLNVAPYIIFHDRSLMEMAAHLPEDKTALGRIFGVGKSKLEQFAGHFLPLIQEYCREKEQASENKTAPVQTDAPRTGKRYLQTYTALQQGTSIEEAAQEFEVKIKTILNHLYDAYQSGHCLEPDWFVPLIHLDQAKQESALAQFQKQGTAYLKPVYLALQQSISYDELQVLRLYYLAQTRTASLTNGDSCG